MIRSWLAYLLLLLLDALAWISIDGPAGICGVSSGFKA